MLPRADATIILPDGRTLGYAEYGDPDGAPTFFFHGWPGCRLGAQLLDGAARRARVRLIGVDRPGTANSTPQRNRRITDWPRDVAALADALGINRFAVIGYSGGGPFALSCAHAMPERVTSALIVAGVGPKVTRKSNIFKRAGMAWVRSGAWWVRLSLWWARRRSSHTPLGSPFAGEWMLSRADRDVLRQMGVRQQLQAEFRESMKNGVGPDGPVRDFTLYAGLWGFDLEDVRVPVHIWHGDADRIVRQRDGRAQCAALPNCTPHWWAGEGHLAIIPHADEVAGSRL